MRKKITDEQRLSAAYSAGKFRQQATLSISLFFINILMLIIMKGGTMGFSIAMFIICGISFYANTSSLRNLEKTYNIKEEDLISTTNTLAK